MENEFNVGKDSLESAGSTDIPISSRVDPTGVMPVFDEGRAVDSMSIEDSQKEWKEMTIDPDGKYGNFPRSVFLSRRDALFKHGFGEKLAKQKETQEEEGRKFLEKENEKIQTREEDFALAEARKINLKFFGNEKVFNEVVKRAAEVVSQFSDNDKEFLKEYMSPNSDLAWGDSPLIISWFANLRGNPDLIKKVKENGIRHYVSLYMLYSKSQRRQR